MRSLSEGTGNDVPSGNRHNHHNTALECDHPALGSILWLLFNDLSRLISSTSVKDPDLGWLPHVDTLASNPGYCAYTAVFRGDKLSTVDSAVLQFTSGDSEHPKAVVFANIERAGAGLLPP